ncbi:acyltransferase [Lithospermum erythrorhizon]|uniref:Acyltransferase n=1 Tax=Lithospermum erythrorhizon TaxID=34254 RepID=A0AAV3QXJ6_LITER
MDLSEITLRKFILSDADDVFLWGGMIESQRTDNWIPYPWCRSICFDDRSIGYVAIAPGSVISGNDMCRTDIGYALFLEYWGKGIATMVLKLAVVEVFMEFPDIVRVQALVDVENKASQRVLEKVGFVKEGVLRKYQYIKGNLLDLIIFRFLSSDINIEEK